MQLCIHRVASTGRSCTSWRRVGKFDGSIGSVSRRLSHGDCLSTCQRYIVHVAIVGVVARCPESILHQYEPILMAACCLVDSKMWRMMVGSGMAKRLNETDEDVAALTVRVPRALVSDIDHERKARAVRVPRNTWILEAVVEKLGREKLHNGSGRGAGDGQE